MQRQKLNPIINFSVLPASDIDRFKEPWFQVAIGGDGAPFGKFDKSCAWLVSFLNIGHKAARKTSLFLKAIVVKQAQQLSSIFQ